MTPSQMTPAELERLAFLRFPPGSLERCLLDTAPDAESEEDAYDRGYAAGKEDGFEEGEFEAQKIEPAAHADGYAEAKAVYERRLEESQTRCERLERHVKLLSAYVAPQIRQELIAELGQ